MALELVILNERSKMNRKDKSLAKICSFPNSFEVPVTRTSSENKLTDTPLASLEQEKTKCYLKGAVAVMEDTGNQLSEGGSVKAIALPETIRLFFVVSSQKTLRDCNSFGSIHVLWCDNVLKKLSICSYSSYL